MRYAYIGSVSAVVAVVCCSAVPVAAQGGGQAAPAAATVETPRDANGHPVLTGVWGGGGGREAVTDDVGNAALLFFARKGTAVNFERDSGIGQRVRPRDDRPWYRPEVWDRVQFNDVHGHNVLAPDPTFQCMPAGVPRIGFPRAIAQVNENTLAFLYDLHQRFVYIDGRPHPPAEEWIGTWFGHSVGHWEGDTLVISTVDFNGQEWIGWPGWYTSPDKEVVERITRVGNTVRWEATVHDPSMFLKPYQARPIIREVNTDPMAEVPEPLPCLERDLQNMATRERG